MKNILFLTLTESYVMTTKSKIPKKFSYFLEIAQYFTKNYNVEAIDCLHPKYSNGEILRTIAKKNYDAIVFNVRMENIQEVLKIIPLIKEISNKTKNLLYGDIVNYAPNFFESSNADGLIISGDWELSINSYLDYIFNNKKIDDCFGFKYIENSKWKKTAKGKKIETGGWNFADPKNFKELIDVYTSITDGEFTITVGRGCPFQCGFCSAIVTFGIDENKKDYKEVVEYMKYLNKEHFIKRFKIFIPTLTIDKKWVRNLCELIIKEKLDIVWTSTTRLDCNNDEELIKLMAESGCYKMAIGVETNNKESIEVIKKYHDLKYIDNLEKTIGLYTKYGIIFRSLIMIGIDGQTKKSIYDLFNVFSKFGYKVTLRPPAYSDRGEYIKLDKEKKLTLEYIQKLDKMTIYNKNIEGLSKDNFLKLIFNPGEYKIILGKN